MGPRGVGPRQSPGETVLKKAATVVACAAAAMLVTTPMASAQTAAPAQASNTCTSTQSGGTITQTLTGGSGLVGGAVVGTVAPVTTQTQAANCTAVNVSDVVDVNSGNTTTSSVRTRIQNSFNRLFILRR
jgi:hypothetical protein